MCGIIGFVSTRVTSEQIKTLKKVMKESRIRGKHASGIAWYNGESILSVVKPKPIDELVEEFDFEQLLNKSVALIAHARYSTSDLKYNQPIVGKSLAIVHNGVITQSPPETWESQYGYKCKTKNDSELLLRAIEHGHNIQMVFPDSSIAALILNDKGYLSYYRNGTRPLWKGEYKGSQIFASTFDILHRARAVNITKIEPTSKYSKELQRRYKHV